MPTFFPGESGNAVPINVRIYSVNLIYVGDTATPPPPKKKLVYTAPLSGINIGLHKWRHLNVTQGSKVRVLANQRFFTLATYSYYLQLTSMLLCRLLKKPYSVCFCVRSYLLAV